jgi:ABC-type amino acid transport substrate-binding protein
MISALSRQLPGHLVPDFVAPAALACLLSVGLVASARAEQPTLLDAITKSGTLRVGLTADYLPFSIAEISGKVEGIDVDMATTWQSRLASSWRS